MNTLAYTYYEELKNDNPKWEIEVSEDTDKLIQIAIDFKPGLHGWVDTGHGTRRRFHLIGLSGIPIPIEDNDLCQQIYDALYINK